MSQISKLTDMQIDEVSLVRRPANQHAAIVFSKSDEGDEMPGQVYTEDGQIVDIDDLPVGTVIVDEDGDQSVIVPADIADEDVAAFMESLEQSDDGYEQKNWQPEALEQEEPQYAYGKSADDYADLVSKAYTEAVTDEDRATLIASVAKQAQIAKADAKRTRDYISKMQAEATVDQCISKAQEYGFAGPRTEEFGVVLAKMISVLDDGELQLMDDIFKAFSELAEEVALGTEHQGYSDVLDVAQAHAGEIIKSFEGNVTAEQAMSATFDANPDLYSLYLAEKGGI